MQLYDTDFTAHADYSVVCIRQMGERSLLSRLICLGKEKIIYRLKDFAQR